MIELTGLWRCLNLPFVEPVIGGVVTRDFFFGGGRRRRCRSSSGGGGGGTSPKEDYNRLDWRATSKLAWRSPLLLFSFVFHCCCVCVGKNGFTSLLAGSHTGLKLMLRWRQWWWWLGVAHNLGLVQVEIFHQTSYARAFAR